MRIVYALDKFRAREGGADGFARGVAAALMAAGHQVRVVEAGAAAEEIPGEAFSLVSRPLPRSRLLRDGDLNMLRGNAAWGEILERELSAWGAQAVLTQNQLAPASVAAARRAGLPSVIFFHGYRCLSPTFFLDQDALSAPPAAFGNVPWRCKLKWPLVSAALKLYAAAYRGASLVVANSAYAAAVIGRFFGREAPVLHPLLDVTVPPPPAAGVREDLLFVKPQLIKGAELILQLAERLPARKFVVAGAAPRAFLKQAARLPNVECRGWVNDMGALYANSALLLGPARLPEPFGRVFVEAGLRGTPSAAASAGGIPEAVGPGGVLLPRGSDAAAWAEAVESALDPARQAELGSQARLHAEALARGHGQARLRQILAQGAGIN